MGLTPTLLTISQYPSFSLWQMDIFVSSSFFGVFSHDHHQQRCWNLVGVVGDVTLRKGEQHVFPWPLFDLEGFGLGGDYLGIVCAEEKSVSSVHFVQLMVHFFFHVAVGQKWVPKSKWKRGLKPAGGLILTHVASFFREPPK